MINISEALRWLNQFDRSHINGISQELIAQARNRRTNNAVIENLVQAALQQSRTSPYDAMDYPETLLSCGAIEFERGLVEPSRTHLSAAVENYARSNDPYGRIVASWMLGIVELALQNTDVAYASWKEATNVMALLGKSHQHVQRTQPWYISTLIKMNQDLVTLPQESFTWLNRFDGSSLSQWNSGLARSIQQCIEEDNPNQASTLISSLRARTKIASNSIECGEIFAETGLAYFRIRRRSEAIKDLEMAIIKFPADCHQQAVARWLCGAVQWGSQAHRTLGLTNWETSLACFVELAKEADQSNRQLEKRWYRDRIAYMKAALKGKKEQYFS